MSIESRSRQYGKVFDHWQIKEFLGSGSGGKTAVFRLQRSDSSWGACALKIVNLIEERGNVEALSDFRRREYEAARAECSRSAEQEVRLMDELRGNTNIVDYLDHTFVDWSDESGFGRDLLIRMELLEDLRSDLKNGRMFSQEEVLKIGRDICAALMLCHRKNILHRDVKPENIFRNKDGNYKLGDFGVSRVLDACPGAVASTGIGTYEYWPAEQMTGRYDKRVDLYSLGLVLYELSNGNRLPFAATSYATGKEVSLRLSGSALPTPSEAGPILAKVILKACAFKPEDRYQSAEEMLKALDWVDRKGKASASVDTLDFWEQNIPTAPARPAAAPKSAFKAQPVQGSEPKSRTKPVRSEKNTDEKKSEERIHRKKKQRPLFWVGLLLCALLLCGAAVFAGKSIGESAWKTRKYSAAKELLEGGNFKEAAAVFEVLGEYRDSAEQLENARLAIEAKTAEALLEEEKNRETTTSFETTGDYQDNTEQQESARKVVDYATAESLAQSGKTAEAAMAFYALGEKERSFELWGKVTAGNSVSAGTYHTVGLKSDGTVVSAGANGYGQCNVDGWTDIIAVSAGALHTVGLKTDGTVVSAGRNDYDICNVGKWTEIIAVSVGSYHTVGLKADGTVVATGYNDLGRCNVGEWTEIIAVSAGAAHTVGLKADGTVIAVGNTISGRCDVDDWTGIVAVSAGSLHTVGLKADGTVVAAGYDGNGQCNVDKWTDIVAVSADKNHTVGLRADGTVVAVGSNDSGQCDVSEWTNIVAISTGPYQTLGLKSDGTIVAVGNNAQGQLNIQDWTDIMLPSSDREQMLSDSTVPVPTSASAVDRTSVITDVETVTEVIREIPDGTKLIDGTWENGDVTVVALDDTTLWIQITDDRPEQQYENFGTPWEIDLRFGTEMKIEKSADDRYIAYPFNIVLQSVASRQLKIREYVQENGMDDSSQDGFHNLLFWQTDTNGKMVNSINTVLLDIEQSGNTYTTIITLPEWFDTSVYDDLTCVNAGIVGTDFYEKLHREGSAEGKGYVFYPINQ